MLCGRPDFQVLPAQKQARIFQAICAPRSVLCRKPCNYNFKEKHHSRFFGKQMAILPHKEGRTIDVYLEKKLNYLGDGDKYADVFRYKDLGMERKKGFVSSDFAKRDEFNNTRRTEQYREQLRVSVAAHECSAALIFE